MLAVFASDVSAAKIEIKQSEGSESVFDYPYLDIRGQIESGDYFNVIVELQNLRSKSLVSRRSGDRILTVRLHSIDGDFREALAIGRLFRENDVQAWVAANEICVSACVFMFLGAVERYVIPGGKLGVHRPTFQDVQAFAQMNKFDAQVIYRELQMEAKNYLAEMDINPELYGIMFSIPSSKVMWIDSDQAENLRLSGKDAAFEEWDSARAQQQIGQEEYQKMQKLINCFNICQRSNCALDPMAHCRSKVGL